MTTTARPQNPVLQRTITSDSTPSSSSNSVSASPNDTPTQSPSATSLSSLGSVDEVEVKNARPALLDTYGNEFEIPDFTIKQIRDAIPKHCFERSAIRGLGYVARDIASLAITFYIFNKYVTPETIASKPARGALWALYSVLQGLFGTGLWVMAHECGHQAFSPSKTLNDTVGWICHSALLVPYFSWKISHSKHHKATGNLERDMVFVPQSRDTYASRWGTLAHQVSELMEETPFYTALHLLGQQLGGWQLYLLANVTGHNNHERQIEGKGKGKRNGITGGVNHFFPSSPLYEKKDEHLILLSDLGLAITASILFLIGKTYGFSSLFVWYIIPYLWVHHWLVAITYLQHTDPSLPHYDAHTWTYTRGAAATIDREFGFIGRTLMHGIIETHVLHHYICTIPFYHADEASDAIRPIMGKHYRADTKGGSLGFITALWKVSRWCQWVEPSEGANGEGKGVLFFRNRNRLGVPPMKIAAPVPQSTAGNMAKMNVIVGADSDNE
ncbi:delta(12) fatty acid desaturas-like protein [Lepidopterella palustris CBS 459.81]|uniref:Delta(12) fatty acid desaturas-like protein n=1 Tax=Lepidopterella palustris CBS 459.81 TaxID=1314670 RepID=A0A8E2JF99_9PEZI|nr:delta(12) fatty acid desaturas-like protein [Lepidopterella palustris CBS 459.81]